MEIIIKTSTEIADTVIPKEYQEEIIRCRDCLSNDDGICSKFKLCVGMELRVDSNDFCAWAMKEWTK